MKLWTRSYKINFRPEGRDVAVEGKVELGTGPRGPLGAAEVTTRMLQEEHDTHTIFRAMFGKI
jgi:hypothetical protein